MNWGRLKRATCRHKWKCVSFKPTGGHLFFIFGAMPARDYVERCAKCGKQRSRLMACAADDMVALTPEIAASCLRTEFNQEVSA